ncbi:hypothetical protein COL41_27805 [Bacillus mycoides]|nr:hypothetical protein COL41_27805 [Bacillus mycoides]QWH81381.1 hypothetical protein EXW59_21555 [Bacillus mycoides]QWI46793.1 hypothetical protein EXW55_14810 [Bacillus mycoides]
MGRPQTLNDIIRNFNIEHPEMMRKIDDYNLRKGRQGANKKLTKDIKKALKENSHNLSALLERKERLDAIMKLSDFQVKSMEEFVEKIKGIFHYDNFCKQYDEKGKRIWGAYELAKQLKMETCPYCNRQFITVSEPNEDDEGRTRPQLDHFYSKSRFPFLAVSFFNLIPCCYVCNSNLKRNQEFSIDTHIHPYEDGFGDLYQFTVQFKKDDKGGVDYLGGGYLNPDEFLIDFKVNELEKKKYPEKEFEELIYKIENNKRTFKLKSLYNSHTDYVGEILEKSMRYNDSKIESLYQEFPNLFPSKYDLLRLIYCNYVDPSQLDKRVLSKLTRDITQEFGLRY